MRNALSRFLDLPETNVVMFAFLLFYPWEFLQAPLYRELVSAPHWQAVKLCTLATVGDAAIALLAFRVVARSAGTRRWIQSPTRRTLLGFIATGVVAVCIIERIAIDVLGWWSYTGIAPVIPGLGVGLVAVLQWVLIPLLIVWFVRRQLR